MSAAHNSDLISAYAGHFNPLFLDRHAVASPLGLWLLLALVGLATTGSARRDLEDVLGTTVHDAAARATTLLGEPHPAVHALAAVWNRDLGPAFDKWARALPDVVGLGTIPDQAQADAWAQASTGGLIAEFPLQIDDLTRLLLASAIATDITWTRLMDVSADLGGEFGTAIAHALVFGDGIGLVADTDAAGLVAVAAPPSRSALDVVSVIAAPDVPPPDVDRAAHQVAAMLRGDDRRAREVPAHELAAGHAWTVTERREQNMGVAVQIHWRNYVPAWSATSNHDVKAAPGVSEVVDALTGFLREEDLPVDVKARQAAVASYSRAGFEAAAVSAIGLYATGAPLFHEVLIRSIDVRFNRPFAVIACAAGDQGPMAWRGVPVFSAWITQPLETAVDAPGVPQPVG
jgi:hypothetical protein